MQEATMEAELLGTVRVPSGVLAVLDMGLLGAWSGDPSACVAEVGKTLSRGERAFAVAGVAGVAVPRVPRDRPLPVVGVRVPGGEYKGLWHAVVIEIAPEATPARSAELGVVRVESARVVFADLDALAAWQHDEPTDGRADVVFWGRDAAEAAAATGAPDLGEETYGFTNATLDEAAERGERVEAWAEEHEKLVVVDYRPHSHHFAMLEQMRASKTESGTLALGPAELTALFTMWGDGEFPVLVDVDAQGNPTRFGVYFATRDAMKALHAQKHAGEFDDP